MSELCLDDFYIYIDISKKITGSEFAAPFTNTILDVIPPHSVRSYSRNRFSRGYVHFGRAGAAKS